MSARTFEEWAVANGHIVAAVWKIADQYRTSGHAHWSIRAVFHILRWKSAIREIDGDYKLNDKWSAELARAYNRRVMYDFFRTREK